MIEDCNDPIRFVKLNTRWVGVFFKTKRDWVLHSVRKVK